MSTYRKIYNSIDQKFDISIFSIFRCIETFYTISDTSVHITPTIQALELLAVLMVDGPEGYRAVLAAMDYFKLVKGERVRFYSLLDALMTDEADLAFKRDVMLFINTLVNRCEGWGKPFFLRAEENL